MSTLVGGTGIIGQDIFCSFGNGKYTTFEGTEIVAENCLKTRVKDLVVEGKTYQNLFNAELNQGHVNSSLTAQQNLRVNSDGFTLDSTTYTICIPSGYQVLVYVNYGFSGDKYIAWANKIVWTNSSSTNNIRIMVRKPDNSEITVDEVIGKIILLEGDYTNTDLPTSIDGIESVAERESINLLENVEWNDGFINMDTGEIETLTSYANAKYSELIDVNINQLYKTNINESNGALRIRIYKSDGTYIKVASGELALNSFANLYKIRSKYAEITKIRLLALDTVKYPLPTKPYVIGNNEDINYPYPINLNNEGKNLINTIIKNKSWDTTTSNLKDNLGAFCTEKIKVKKNTTYVYSLNGSINNIGILCFNSEKKHVSNKYDSRITVTDGIEYLALQGRDPDIGKGGEMLEEGTVTTSYEPYREPIITNINMPIPLRSLPNGTCDTIEENRLVQRVGKVVLNGSENWTESSSYNIIQITLVCNHKPQQNVFISNIFNSVGNHDKEGVSFGNSLNLWINKNRLTSPDIRGAKQWLSENPVTIYYELATPIIHDLEIPSISTVRGTNIITTSNNIKPKISMKVKVKKMFGKIENNKIIISKEYLEGYKPLVEEREIQGKEQEFERYEETEQIKAPNILSDTYTSITADTEVQPNQVDFIPKAIEEIKASEPTINDLIPNNAEE